jgi:catechol 2,3-dioxygenase-like lactoylglutathione lyase family enzyme
MQIERLDHLVLTVASIPTSLDFYQRVLAFEPREKDGRWSLHFSQQKINLHQADHTFDPKAAHPTPGSADLCFITSNTPEQTITHLKALNIPIEEGPIERTGALGKMTSVYFRDPDGNLLEVANYLNQTA